MNFGSQSATSSFTINTVRFFSKLNDCITCPQTNRKEETAVSRLRIGHLYITCSFLLKGEEPPVCILYDEQPLNIFYLL